VIESFVEFPSFQLGIFETGGTSGFKYTYTHYGAPQAEAL
jgi:hypothetical protein